MFRSGMLAAGVTLALLAPAAAEARHDRVAKATFHARDGVVAHQLFAHEEERGADAGRVERLEDRGRAVRVGPVVEGQRRAARDALEAGHPAPALGGLEQLGEAGHANRGG